MIGWFVRGAMDLAWTVKYVVQDGWSLIVSFIWLLPLARLGATESGVDRGVIGIVTVASTLVPVASGLAAAVFDFGGACFACRVFATGQPTILTRTKASHECREGCHGLRLFLAEVSAEPFVTDAMLKGR